jgi:hypothetical protein
MSRQISIWKDVLHHVTRKMQISNEILLTTHPLQKPNCWSGYGAIGTLTHCWWKDNFIYFEVPYKIKHNLTIWSSNLAPWQFAPRRESRSPHKNPHFTATLSITAQTWKQPRCPSTGESINCGTTRLRTKKKWAIFMKRQRRNLNGMLLG